MSLKTATVIQAIKALGKDGVRKKDIQKIKNNLSPKEKTELIKDSTAVAAWVYEIIREICKNEDK